VPVLFDLKVAKSENGNEVGRETRSRKQGEKMSARAVFASRVQYLLAHQSRDNERVRGLAIFPGP
jgi:hypothetical protein